MAIKTQAQLEAQAAIIRDEVASKANTATRIGVMIIDFVQSVYDSKAELTDITAAIDLLKDAVPVDGDTLNKLYILIQDLDSKVTPPVTKNYIDTAAMIADQAILPQLQGSIYSVGTYPTILYYEYLGTTVGDITDYSLIGDINVPVKAVQSDIDLGTNDEKFITPLLFVTNALLASNNLSDLNNAATARLNLDVYSTGEVDAMFVGILDYEKYYISPDLENIVIFKDTTPIQLTEKFFNGVTTATYRSKLDDGIDTYTDRASLAALNTYLSGLADSVDIDIEFTLNSTEFTVYKLTINRS